MSTAPRPRSGWNFADVWEAVADRFPEAPAQVCDGRVFSWREFDRRADGLAGCLYAAAGARQATVAQYLYNGPEYLETLYACFKAALVPVNTNYRYTDDELFHVWADAGVVAVVFHGSFTGHCARLRSRLPGVRAWVHVDDGTEPCPAWAIPYEEAAGGSGRMQPPWRRGGDDLLLLYTGGTTGQPKGVMWEQETLFRLLERLNGREAPGDGDACRRAAGLGKPGPRILPAAPLMHGAALWFSLPYLSAGGSVLTVRSPRFDAGTTLDAAHAQRANALGIVGEVFARPLLDRLRHEPIRWDLSGLRFIFSSGVALAEATKSELVRYIPTVTVVDSLGSSETGGIASSRTTAGEEAPPTGFSAGPGTRVVDERWEDVSPGSGRLGRVALSGFLPRGYHNDPEKTRATFVTVGGTRYALSGDVATVEADGRIVLVGRGSSCINTGGEKVYAEEVEEAIRRDAAVADVVVVGVPDDRFGQSIAAVVQLTEGGTLGESDVIARVRPRLAAYKLPRFVFFEETIARGPNGKADRAEIVKLAQHRVRAAGSR